MNKIIVLLTLLLASAAYSATFKCFNSDNENIVSFDIDQGSISGFVLGDEYYGEDISPFRQGLEDFAYARNYSWVNVDLENDFYALSIRSVSKNDPKRSEGFFIIREKKSPFQTNIKRAYCLN